MSERPRDDLDGHWTVERESGLLPPLGLSKRIRGRSGTTRVLGVPVARFTVRGTTLDYAPLPVRDELVPTSDGAWHGTAYALGARFGTFRLRRASRRTG